MNKVKNQKKRGALGNLLINVVLPSLIMSKGDKWFSLSATNLVLLALVFPLFYGLWELYREKKWNIFSIIGIGSILMTGGISYLSLPKEYIAIKEAAVPLILCGICVISLRSRNPVGRLIFFNDEMVNTEGVLARIEERGVLREFSLLIEKATWMIAGSLFLSSALNYLLAKWIIKSEVGSEAFTKELGRMTALSYPVIVVPCMVVILLTLWFWIKTLRRLSGMSVEDIFKI